MSKTIYLEKTDTAATCTTWIYCFMAQMWAAEQLGIEDVYINWEQGHEPFRHLCAYEDYDMPKNQFEWFFTQPKTEFPYPRNESTIWTYEHENWDSGIDMNPYQLMAQPLSVIRDYYQKHLHFNAETNRRGEDLVSKYGIDFSKTIGLTWRGGDCELDGRPKLPISYWYPWIDKILEKEPDCRIACTSEEDGILAPLLSRYPNSFVITDFLTSPFQSQHNPERHTPVSGYLRGLQPALMVWLFSKCKYYIKNRSSTGAVASWLNKDGEIYSIAHGENLGFPANLPSVEFKGQKYTFEGKLIEG